MTETNTKFERNDEFIRNTRFRMRIIRQIRRFFDQQDFDELLIPILGDSAPAEPTIYPFSTHWNRAGVDTTLYLPVSPERSMKFFLSRGFEQCYSIGHCFRNLEGAGPTHHPEFLMLEWYRPDTDYHTIIADTQALLRQLATELTGGNVISFQGQRYDLSRWETLSVESLWQKHFGVSIQDVYQDEPLRRLASKRGYQVADSDWEQLFNQLFLNEIESQLPATPFVLLDFPAKLSPLCRPRADKPWLAERFEVYVAGIELGNGNSEQLDAQTVTELFESELAKRQQRGEPVQPLDRQMLTSIARLGDSGHSWAGMGLGVDRVAMLLGDLPGINQWWPKLA